MEAADGIEDSNIGGRLNGLVEEGSSSTEFEDLNLENELLERCSQHLWQLVVGQFLQLVFGEQVVAFAWLDSGGQPQRNAVTH